MRPQETLEQQRLDRGGLKVMGRGMLGTDGVAIRESKAMDEKDVVDG